MKYQFIQIGSHTGNTPNDPIFSLAMQNWNGILVEPLIEHFAELKKTYLNYPNVIFERCAICEKEGEQTMYVPTPQARYMTQVASLKKEHLTAHGIKDRHMRKESVPSMRLKELLDKHNVEYCKYFVVDVEGMDDEIICSMPSDFLPEIIVYESKNIDETARGRAWEKLKPNYILNEWFGIHPLVWEYAKPARNVVAQRKRKIFS